MGDRMDDVLTSYERRQAEKKAQEEEARRQASAKAEQDLHRKAALKKAEQEFEQAKREMRQLPPARTNNEAQEQLVEMFRKVGDAQAKVQRYSN